MMVVVVVENKQVAGCYSVLMHLIARQG
jgi:hypothetical protein